MYALVSFIKQWYLTDSSNIFFSIFLGSVNNLCQFVSGLMTINAGHLKTRSCVSLVDVKAKITFPPWIYLVSDGNISCACDWWKHIHDWKLWYYSFTVVFSVARVVQRIAQIAKDMNKEKILELWHKRDMITWKLNKIIYLISYKSTFLKWIEKCSNFDNID